MFRGLILALAAALAAVGSLALAAAPEPSPARVAGNGPCYDVYVYVGPNPGVTVCPYD